MDLRILTHTPEPKRTIAQQRYRDYRQSEYGGSFSEWLGIDLPMLEYSNGKCRYRRLSYDLYFNVEAVTGEWCATKKAAKASYKEALRKLKGE